MHSLLLLLLTLPAAEAPAPLRAGAAAVDVTPKQYPVNLPGNFAENLAEKSSDALHVRAIVLDDGKTTVALVLVDNLGVVREVCDEVKLLASRKLSMLPENILISSTHTHSAPPANVKAGRPGEVAYRKQLIDGMVEAIVKAGAARRPAKVGAATHPLPDEVFNRRWFLKPGKMTPNPFGGIDLVRMNPPTTMDVLSHPAGPTDPDVSVLSFNDAKTNKPLALYANYSLHYVGGIPPKIASSDYFGEFARLMPNRVGGDDRFVAMLTNGASGDINNIPFGVGRPPREPFEQIRLVAARTADAAYHARAKITHQADVPLGMVQRPLTLRMRRPDAKQVAWAKEVLAEKDEKKVLPLAPAYARRYMRLAESDEKVEVLLQAVRIGDVAICAIPFETFVQIGLDIKKRSPFGKTIVVGLANGYTGYLPTPEQHRLGGYETWLGTNWVQEDTSVLITNQMLEMLNKLAKEKQQ
ncbi:MAG: hypothetical protein U0840_29090 [Gemmataceae bacterium]